MKLPLLALTLGLATAALAFPVRQDPPKETGPVVGKPAPTIRLNDHTGSAVSLGGESETWTVMAFYPKAATPG